MNKLLLLLSISFVGQIQGQTWVTIPDANFVTYLQATIPSAMSGNQMNTASTIVTTRDSIDVHNKSISNMFGIQYFTSLTYLNCGNNYNITSLPALPSTLTYLDCYTNALTSLPALPNGLTQLWCENNSLTSLPTLPNSLTGLYCFNNQLTSLPVLPNSLTRLDCWNNHITCFPTFPNTINFFVIDPGNSYNCFPNYITAMNSTQLSTPLCAAGNTNGCPVATGIEQIKNNIQLSVYPNPTSDQFYIEANTTDKLTVDLYDLNGRHVFSASVSDKSIINVSSFNEGVYTLTIKSVDSVTNKKLIIVR